jgi:carboxyl-terminal processing protease
LSYEAGQKLPYHQNRGIVKKLGLFILVLCFSLAACERLPLQTPAPAATQTIIPTLSLPTGTPTPTLVVVPTATPGMSPEAAAYLNAALDIMEKHSLNKNKIDWPEFRANIIRMGINAKTPADTYPLIKIALSGLQDHHSFFMAPQDALAMQEGTIPTSVPPEIKLVDGKFGYLLLPGYAGLNQAQMNQYATDMQNQIKAIDGLHPCGWIVDLRGNLGGNMWPMLVGVGPILGEGKAGMWLDPDGNYTDWSYEDGQGLIGASLQSEVIGQPYALSKAGQPVAVLFGRQTYSSGEIIAISFIGRPNTRSFGSESGGLTTSNGEYALSDGALILLTDGVDVDRNGKAYGGPIVPDVQVSGWTDSAGPVPPEALEWLSGQPGCQHQCYQFLITLPENS